MTQLLLQPEEISPDKVIEQTIIARQKSLWDQFFLYMDLEEMLIKYNLKGTAVSGKLEPFGSVQTARSTIEVVGKESDVKNMCKEIVSSKYIVRIDDFAMADNGDGTVTAAFSIVNFTK